MAGLIPAIPFSKVRPCHIIGIAGSSPAMTARVFVDLIATQVCFPGGVVESSRNAGRLICVCRDISACHDAASFTAAQGHPHG
jgi:hypothetical protein